MGRSMTTIRGAVLGAVGMLLSMSVAAQGSIGSDLPAFVLVPSTEPATRRVGPYADEMSGGAPAVPYSCYRVGRCSADDLYRFRDRPHRLTRLAPQAPLESVVLPPSIHYLWSFVPVTPEENILPRYRTASQIRDEYRDVGRPIDGAN